MSPTKYVMMSDVTAKLLTSNALIFLPRIIVIESLASLTSLSL
jgi:hypothetical protein